MARKVKCQHCWKVFEVADHFVNKQRPCTFCQRTTLAQPVDDDKVPEKNQLSPVSDNSLNTVSALMGGMLMFTLVQTMGLVLLLGKTSLDIDREALAQKQHEYQVSLDEINRTLQSCQTTLKKSEQSLSSPNTTALSLTQDMKPSIQLILDRLAQLESDLENLRGNLAKLQPAK